MIRRLTFILFALLIGGIAGYNDIADVEVAQDVVEELELEDLEPTTCPGIDGCLHHCPLGRERDEEGCRTCACKQSGKFEGDILVSDKDYWRLLERYDHTAPTTPSKRKKRGAMSLKESEWPRKGSVIEIPYVLGTAISGLKKKRIMEAIEQYRSRTCLRFVPRKSQTDYIEFTGLGGCSSHVGKIGGRQTVTIGMNCENKLGTVVHEMMHAIGFWHEQSRGDRDHYVEIQWDNVIEPAKGNFKKQERFWNNYNSIYDLNSVMHYGGEFFTKERGQPTIVNKKTGETIMAQRENFSPEDVRQINRKYKCASYLVHDKPVEMPTFAPECKDDLATSSCKKYLTKGYCKYDTMKEKCKVTCKTCVPGKPAPSAPKKVTCKDSTSSASCNLMKGKGFCKSSKKTMAKFCKKTCNLCGGVTSVSCTDKKSKCKTWARSGYCTKASHKKFLASACKKSCGHCSADAPIPEELFDMLITG